MAKLRISQNSITSRLQMIQYRLQFCFWAIMPLCFHIASTVALEVTTVTNIGDISVTVNATWTNASNARIIPPGDFSHDTLLGVIAFESGFSTNFLNALTAITNGTGTNVFLQYPVQVIETTNGTGRIRLYLSAASTNPVPAYTTTVAIANYPEAWIEDVYGDVPEWLGTEQDAWFADRDPWRTHILFDLISTGSVPAYIAMLTNAVSYVNAESNTISRLNLYSNDIAFVAAKVGTSGVDLYIHAPTNVPGFDIFSSTNLLDPCSWFLPATVEHVLDPVVWNSDYPYGLNFFAAGNTAVDTDQDGLSDARERRLFGTYPYLADSDGDGLSDGIEVLTYGLNPLNTDSDGDGIPDNLEVAGNTNPNSSDSDGDGLTDYAELYTYFGHVDPLDPDTDDDGLSDYEEMVTYLSYPRTDDSDMDGLSDYEETYVHSTDPLDPDTDGDGIHDSYEISKDWDPNDPATATANDDGDAFNNLTEYEWNYSPTSSNSTPPTIQRLVLCPPGNAPLDSGDIRFLSVSDLGTDSSRIRVRPFYQGGALAAQLLHHTQSPGFQINGVNASNVATPIFIPAGSSAVEYRITSDTSARGTNLYFRLTSTNDPTFTKDSAYCYFPEISKVNFWVPEVGNNVDVYYGQTNTLWIGMPADTNACRVRMQPFQGVNDGLGTPTFSHTDYILVKVTGTGADPSTNTLNQYDWQSAYGVWFNDIRNQGIRLDYGSYIFEVGFDMNLNGILEAAEVQQTCNVHVPRIDLNGDYNRDGNPVDHPNETNAVTFAGPKGFTILVNANDSDGDGQPDCEESGDPPAYYINGTNDLDDIFILRLSRLGISTNDMPDDLKVTISVLKPGTETLTDNAVIYPIRQAGQQGYYNFTLSAASTRLLFGGTGTVDMGIEGRAFGEQVTVRMQLKKGTKLLGTDEIRVLVAPFFARSNGDPAEVVYSGAGSADWTNCWVGLTNCMNGVVPVEDTTSGVFLQDRAEIGYTCLPSGMNSQEIPVFLILGAYSDFSGVISTNTQRYFYGGGNGGSIETSIPDANNGYGRIIVGNELGSITNFLKRQNVQTVDGEVIVLGVDWLEVGHVDEVCTILPIESGFKVFVADVDLAIELLTNTSYNTTGGFPSRADIAEVYSDTNNTERLDLVRNRLASIRSSLALGLGISEECFTKVPVAFSASGWTMDNPEALSYLPNMINLLAVSNESGARRLAIPEPWYDPFRVYLAGELTAIGYDPTEIFWIDTREAHAVSGEIHCVTNVKRYRPE